MLGASAAGLFEPFAKGFAGPVDADCGILCRYPGLLRQIIEAAIIQIDDPQGVTILWLQSVEETGDTLADFVTQLWRRFVAVFEIPPPRFHGSRRCRAVSVMIDHGIAQDTIEPSHNLFVLDAGPMLQSACKSRLQDIFSCGPGLHTLFQKRQELAMPCH